MIKAKMTQNAAQQNHVHVWCYTRDSKVYGAKMGPTWGRQDPGGPHVGRMNLAIWDTPLHWGRVTHKCVSKITIIGSDNGLSPGQRQAIIWNNAGILLIRPLGTNFSEIFIGVQTFSFKKMDMKMSSEKWRPFRLGLNGLIAADDEA